jgi:hypothetical protein
VRREIDWANVSMDWFREQSRVFCEKTGRDREQVNRSVDLWDSTFRVGFFETRRAIKQIAMENFQSVTGAEVVPLESLATGDLRGRDGYLVFIDDDDWLHPDLHRHLLEADDGGSHAIVWRSSRFGGSGNHIVLNRAATDGFCFTNNYAISLSRFASTFPKLIEVFDHSQASRTLDPGKKQLIGSHLSVTNKNPTSTVYLTNALQGRFDRDLLQEVVADFVRRCGLIREESGPDSQWAVPFMERTAELFRALT